MCDPSTRKPALKFQCQEWEKCMKQDPENLLKTSKVTAKLMAEILNDFVEPLELKTMIFGSLLVFGYKILIFYNL